MQYELNIRLAYFFSNYKMYQYWETLFEKRFNWKIIVLAKGGVKIHKFTFVSLEWSIFEGYDYGFIKLATYNHLKFLFKYMNIRN